MASVMPPPATSDRALHAFGASASGTPGTAITSLAAASSHFLAELVILVNAAGLTSQIDLTLTYTDATSTSFTITPGAGTSAGVILRGLGYVNTGGANTAFVPTDKAVRMVEAVTAGIGTGNRRVAIHAREVPT